MTELSRFWTGTSTGDAGPYSAAQMQELLKLATGYDGPVAVGNNNSVLLGTGDGANDPLAVLPSSPAAASVRVAQGAALIEGVFYTNSGFQALTIAANASGNPRIDTIILRVDYVAQTVRLVVKQGTPAGSPARPTLTQNTGVLWEAPLADVAVANGFATILAASITNYPTFDNLWPVLAHDAITNTNGSEMKTGDVAAFDTVTGGRAAKKTTTANDPKVAGVWVGLTPNSSAGRVIFSGIAVVNVSAAVAVGDQLVTSTTGGAARKVGSGERYVFAVALTASAGVGQVLAQIMAIPAPANFHSGVSVTRTASDTSSGSYKDISWTAEVYDTDNYIAVPSVTFTIPITGRYLITTLFDYTNGGSVFNVKLSVNGSQIKQWSGASSISPSVTPSLILALNAGDTLVFAQRNATSFDSGSIQIELLTG